MFLHAGGDTEKKFKDSIRSFSQELWDLRLKLSPATRTLAECEKFDPNNVEFAISLLDCRYLAGDPQLFARLHDKLIPKLVSRESRLIVQRLTRPDPRPLQQIRRHRFSPRTQRERWPGRPAGLQPGVLAGPDLGDGRKGQLARRSISAARSAAPAV